MVFSKLGLVTVFFLGFSTSVCAENTLADVFKKGQVKGELKAWYWDQTTDSTNVNIMNRIIINY